jgi:hypothetical protein
MRQRIYHGARRAIKSFSICQASESGLASGIQSINLAPRLSTPCRIDNCNPTHCRGKLDYGHPKRMRGTWTEEEEKETRKEKKKLAATNGT